MCRFIFHTIAACQVILTLGRSFFALFICRAVLLLHENTLQITLYLCDFIIKLASKHLLAFDFDQVPDINNLGLHLLLKLVIFDNQIFELFCHHLLISFGLVFLNSTMDIFGKLFETHDSLINAVDSFIKNVDHLNAHVFMIVIKVNTFIQLL